MVPVAVPLVSPSSTGLPHLRQNFAPGAIKEPHFVQLVVDEGLLNGQF